MERIFIRGQIARAKDLNKPDFLVNHPGRRKDLRWPGRLLSASRAVCLLTADRPDFRVAIGRDREASKSAACSSLRF